MSSFRPGPVLEAFDDVIAYAERRAREAIAAFPTAATRPRVRSSDDREDASRFSRRHRRRRPVEIDFEGTAGAPANVNAPLAVTRAACTFAVKVALGADVPVNAGLFPRSTSGRRKAPS